MSDQKPKSPAETLAELATAANDARALRDAALQTVSNATGAANAELVRVFKQSFDASEIVLWPLRQKLQDAEAAVVSAEAKFHDLASSGVSRFS